MSGSHSHFSTLHSPLTPIPPGYKQTDVGVIPEEWEAVTVGSLGSFTSGCGISVAALCPQSSDHPIPVFGGNGIAGYTKRAIVSEPTVVVGRVGQRCGEVYLTKGPAWITDNALYPRAIRRKLDVRFLSMALAAAGLNDVKNRNDLPLVTQNILHAVCIPWPPDTVEQRAIAEALSDVDGLLSGLDRLITKKRDLKQAVMQQLLTGQTRLPGFHGEWEVKQVLGLGEVVTGATPRTEVAEYWGGSYPWITPTDISTLRDMFSSERCLTQKGLDAVRVLPPNTVLITCIASIGKNAILKTIGACNQQINAVIPGKNSDAVFLYYLFEASKQYLLANAGMTATRIISKRDFAELTFRVPAFAEQTAIAEVLTDMDSELAGLEQRREKTRTLKQAMMQELLTGRTRLING